MWVSALNPYRIMVVHLLLPQIVWQVLQMAHDVLYAGAIAARAHLKPRFKPSILSMVKSDLIVLSFSDCSGEHFENEVMQALGSSPEQLKSLKLSGSLVLDF